MGDTKIQLLSSTMKENKTIELEKHRCNECQMEFTSNSVLDAHLQGARHARRIRSKMILASLEESEVAFSKDQDNNTLKCHACNISLNSIQQLQTHLNAKKHIKKTSKTVNNNSSKSKRIVHYANKLDDKSAVLLVICLAVFSLTWLLLISTFALRFYSS